MNISKRSETILWGDLSRLAAVLDSMEPSMIFLKKKNHRKKQTRIHMREAAVEKCSGRKEKCENCFDEDIKHIHACDVCRQSQAGLCFPKLL